MSSNKPAFNYPVLRMIVMALHNQGLQLKQPGLTFAHGNMGNQFIDQAKFFDSYLADLEPTDHIIMVKKSVVEGEENYLAHKLQVLEEAHATLRSIYVALDIKLGEGHTVLDVIGKLKANQKPKKKAK